MMKKTKVIPVKNEYEQLMSVQSVQPMMTETNETSFVSLHSEVATKQVEVKNADEQDDKNFSDKEQELIRMYKQQTKLLSMKESIAFYSSFVGSVEISRNGELCKVFYAILSEAKFITMNIKYDMIYNQNKNSDQERIEQFINQITKYRGEMVFQQKIDIYMFLRIFVKNWRSIKDASYFLVILISIYQMIT